MATTDFDWSAVAAAWDEYRGAALRTQSPVVAALHEQLAVRPGERVLELGCGSGEVALTMSELVGPTGRVVASDVAEGMVEVAARTLAGVPQAEVRRIDAAATGLADESFEAVAFVMGLMFVAEAERAAAEVRRVLVPGGRAFFSVWAGPDKNPWLSSLGTAAMMHRVVAGGPPVGPGGLFSLAEPDRFAEVLAAGGFPGVEVQHLSMQLRWPDADTWFDHVSRLSGPLAVALAAAPPDTQQEVRTTATGLIGRFATDDGLVVPALALLALVRR